MEIVWLNTEVDAIHYVYDYAVPKQIPLDTFEKFVRSSKEGTLPEFYVISENGIYFITSRQKRRYSEAFYISCMS